MVILERLRGAETRGLRLEERGLQRCARGTEWWNGDRSTNRSIASILKFYFKPQADPQRIENEFFSVCGWNGRQKRRCSPEFVQRDARCRRDLNVLVESFQRLSAKFRVRVKLASLD